MRCTECGLGYQNPRIPPSEIGDCYPTTYYTHNAGERAEMELPRIFGTYNGLKLLKPPRLHARLLDIGCGSGLLVARYLELGWSAEGFDVDPAAALAARARGIKVTVAPSLLAACYEAGSFDAITMWDSLEHIPDTRNQLREAVRLLKLGGHLSIGVPDLDSWPSRLFREHWHHVDAPVHYTYWSRQSISAAAAKLGLRVSEVKIPRATACTRLSALHAGHKLAATVLAPAWKVFDKVVKGGHLIASLQKLV